MEQLTEHDMPPATEDTVVAGLTEEASASDLSDTPDVSADTPDDVPSVTDADIDYEALAAEDLATLQKLVPGISHITHIKDLPGAARYAELRDRGLNAEEAFWAACHASVAPRGGYDNRSHLRSAVPRGAGGNPAVMTAAEMHAAKELFEDLSESEIQKLYAKCRS